MQTSEHSMLSLEEELTTIETDAIEEEQENARNIFALLDGEEKSIKRNRSLMPYPDVDKFDVGVDYADISDMQYKKRQNKRGYEALEYLDHYLTSRRLLAGHCAYSNGADFFITEDPQLDTKAFFNGEPILLINADDKRYADRIRRWQFPSEYGNVSISRAIHMRGQKVEDVDIRIDRSNKSATNIEDAFLRKALIRNKNKSGIESIIQTIQRKQDQIRLLPKEQSFIVQGCAGSGKTMVLLHRLRYLIYNREISSNEYLFLVPTSKFKSFIHDVCTEFRINVANVIPVQTYYMTLAGERNADETLDISELVFSPAYLKRVYSREFMQDVIKALLQIFLDQADVLISSCDAALSEIMETTSKKLAEDIKTEQDNAVALAPSIIERVQPYIKKAVKKYADIDAVLKKLQTDYEKAEQKYKSIVEFDVSQLERTKQVISLNPQLAKLQSDVKAAEARVKQASIFTVRTQRQKLDILQRQFEQEYSQAVANIEEEERKLRQEQAITAMFVYDDIALGEAKEIIEDLRYLVDEVQHAIDEKQKQLDGLQDVILEKYHGEIQLLNNFIEKAPMIMDDCSVAIETVTPPINTLLQYIRQGCELLTAYTPLCSKKELRKQENHCKLFKERLDRDNRMYLFTLLFNACKRLIKTEFDVKISRKYKHYWYLYLYCEYLTRGISAPDPHRYLYIDEAQDLSRMEIELINKLNVQYTVAGDSVSPKMPVLNLFGDINQVITQHGMDSWEGLSFTDDVRKLNENFRNTNQIIDFCNRMFPFKMQKIGVDLEAVSECRTFDEALKKNRSFYQGSVFIVHDDYALMDLRDLLLQSGIETYEAFTVKEAKGLEFRQVCVFDTDMSQHEAYIAYTRALVNLTVIHTLPRNELNHISMIVAGEEPDEEEQTDNNDTENTIPQ